MRWTALRAKKGLAVSSLLAFLLLVPLAVAASAADRGNHDRDNREITHHHPYVGNWDDWGWGWRWGWGPFYHEPYWYYQPDTGKIKLEQVDGKDQVYINGALTGKAADLKTIKLMPGSYSLEVKHNGKDALKEQVYVIPGKTVKLNVGDKGQGD